MPTVQGFRFLGCQVQAFSMWCTHSLLVVLRSLTYVCVCIRSAQYYVGAWECLVLGPCFVETVRKRKRRHCLHARGTNLDGGVCVSWLPSVVPLSTAETTHCTLASLATAGPCCHRDGNLKGAGFCESNTQATVGPASLFFAFFAKRACRALHKARK